MERNSEVFERRNNASAIHTGLWILAVWLLWFEPGCFAENAEEPSVVQEVPADFMGENFEPGEVPQELLEMKGVFLLRKVNIPADQSDWERLDLVNSELEVKSVSIYGFEKLARATVNDKVHRGALLEKFASGLNANYVFRPCVSDVGTAFGAPGVGVYLGVLKFEFVDSEPIIVGVGQTNFFLGKWYGSERQSFYSLPLSEALHDYLRQRFQIDLEPNVRSGLAGNRYRKLPKVFEERTGAGR